jgi:protein-tyrosine phosphatase
MRILFVDARSLAARAGVALEFSSAGLKDKHAGDTADPRTIEACQARGYDLGGFRCREITDRDYAECGLILAMDRDNLAQLEARRPAGSTTRIELFLGDAEVPDPYYGGADGFTSMMDQIESGARNLIGRHG